MGTIMNLKTDVSINPSAGHAMKDIPHGPNINPSLSRCEGKVFPT